MDTKFTVKVGPIQNEPDELVVVNLFEGVTEPGGATAAIDQVTITSRMH